MLEAEKTQENYQERHLVAVYGSLLSGLSNHGRLQGKGDAVKFVGTTKTKPEFTLVSLNAYPGLIHKGEQSVVVEVYDVTDSVLKGPLDGLEGYYPNDEERSYYIRRKIHTDFGPAWVYLLGDEYLRRPVVESGDWRQFKTSNN